MPEIGNVDTKLAMPAKCKISYFLQTKANFYDEAETELKIGRTLMPQVLDQIEKNLQKAAELIEHRDEVSTDPVRQCIKKYQEMTNKEAEQVQLAIKSIPCEPSTAIRYLLDPAMLTAILFPAPGNENTFDAIEVNRYINEHNKQAVTEIFMRLSLPRLGKLEIIVKSIKHSIYTRIWADTYGTEELLRSQIRGIESCCSRVEIISASDGPLIMRDANKNMDIRI